MEWSVIQNVLFGTVLGWMIKSAMAQHNLLRKKLDEEKVEDQLKLRTQIVKELTQVQMHLDYTPIFLDDGTMASNAVPAQLNIPLDLFKCLRNQGLVEEELLLEAIECYKALSKLNLKSVEYEYEGVAGKDASNLWFLREHLFQTLKLHDKRMGITQLRGVAAVPSIVRSLWNWLLGDTIMKMKRAGKKKYEEQIDDKVSFISFRDPIEEAVWAESREEMRRQLMQGFRSKSDSEEKSDLD